jgi:ribosomal protein S18 acetylase RimI-like enzyme
MGLRPGHRNRGIGRRLLQLAIDHARLHNGIEKVELEVFRSNGHAISFYEKSGFQHEGCRHNGRKLDGKYDDIILMGMNIMADPAHNEPKVE